MEPERSVLEISEPPSIRIISRMPTAQAERLQRSADKLLFMRFPTIILILVARS